MSTTLYPPDIEHNSILKSQFIPECRIQSKFSFFFGEGEKGKERRGSRYHQEHVHAHTYFALTNLTPGSRKCLIIMFSDLYLTRFSHTIPSIHPSIHPGIQSRFKNQRLTEEKTSGRGILADFVFHTFPGKKKKKINIH